MPYSTVCLNNGIPNSCYNACESSLQANVTGFILTRSLLADPTDIAEWTTLYNAGAGDVRFFLYSNGSEGGSPTTGKGYGQNAEETTGYDHTLTLEYRMSLQQFASFNALTKSTKGWFLYFTSPELIWTTGYQPTITVVKKIEADLKQRVVFDVVVKWVTGNEIGSTPALLNFDDLAAVCPNP